MRRDRARPARQYPADRDCLVPAGARLLLIYDGWCGVCTRLVDWLRARDPTGRVALAPSQMPGLCERAGLSRAQADAAAWAFDREGRRYRAAAAINHALAELDGWRWLAAPYRLAIIRQSEDAFYRWFAANRHRFSRWGALPGCARPGAECLPEGTRSKRWASMARRLLQTLSRRRKVGGDRDDDSHVQHARPGGA